MRPSLLWATISWPFIPAPSLFKVGSFLILPYLISCHLISSHVFSPYLDSSQLIAAVLISSHVICTSSSLLSSSEFFSFQLSSASPFYVACLSSALLSAAPLCSCQIVSTHAISSHLSLSHLFYSSSSHVFSSLLSSLHISTLPQLFHLLSWSQLFSSHLSSLAQSLLQNQILAPAKATKSLILNSTGNSEGKWKAQKTRNVINNSSAQLRRNHSKMRFASGKRQRYHVRSSKIEQQWRRHSNAICKQRGAKDNETTCATATRSNVDAVTPMQPASTRVQKPKNRITLARQKLLLAKICSKTIFSAPKPRKVRFWSLKKEL